MGPSSPAGPLPTLSYSQQPQDSYLGGITFQSQHRKAFADSLSFPPALMQKPICQITRVSFDLLHRGTKFILKTAHLTNKQEIFSVFMKTLKGNRIE